MNIADVIVLAVIIAVLTPAVWKISRDRRRVKALGADAMPMCAGCPIAVDCCKKDSGEGCSPQFSPALPTTNGRPVHKSSSGSCGCS